MTERAKILATMGTAIYARNEITDTNHAIALAEVILSAAEAAEAAKEPQNLTMSLHTVNRRFECTAEACQPHEHGYKVPYDVIKLGWDLTLFIERGHTIQLHAVLSALIAPPKPPIEE